jgi:hypothetical protein
MDGIILMEGGCLNHHMGELMKKTPSRIAELTERIEQLESVGEHNFSLIRELINIMREMPIGHFILRRAENRQRLFNLKYTVLPRRQRELLNIINMSIPRSIKEGFVAEEVKLIKSATRAIQHREYYEQNASTSRLKFNFSSYKKEISHAGNQ